MPFLIISALCLTGGALAQMRSATTVRRGLSLLAWLTATWLVSTAALAAYWHGPRVPGHALFHWSDTAVPLIHCWVIVVCALLLPAMPGSVRWAVRPWGPAWLHCDRVPGTIIDAAV